MAIGRIASTAIAALVFGAVSASAQTPEAPAPPAKRADLPKADLPAAPPGEKTLSGMSILGNDEAPRSLVIVPWKSSDLGAEIDVSWAMDEHRRPIDPAEFRRALSYYQIRVEQSARPGR